eukprot:Nk52_evm13s225 gene=Nk52_evmTU13s225
MAVPVIVDASETNEDEKARHAKGDDTTYFVPEEVNHSTTDNCDSASGKDEEIAKKKSRVEQAVELLERAAILREERKEAEGEREEEERAEIDFKDPLSLFRGRKLYPLPYHLEDSLRVFKEAPKESGVRQLMSDVFRKPTSIVLGYEGEEEEWSEEEEEAIGGHEPLGEVIESFGETEEEEEQVREAGGDCLVNWLLLRRAQYCRWEVLDGKRWRKMNTAVKRIIKSKCLLKVVKLAMESEQGHAEATYGLYRVALSGIMQGGPDPKSAFKYMKKCVTQSLHPFYSLKLAECYYRGIGVEEDKETAMKIFPRIAEYVRHEDSDFEVWLFSLAMYIQIEGNHGSSEIESAESEILKLRGSLLGESDLVKFMTEPHGDQLSSLFSFIAGKCILHRVLKNIPEVEAIKYFEKAHRTGLGNNALAYVGYCQMMGIGITMDDCKGPGKDQECIEGIQKIAKCCADDILSNDKEVKYVLNMTNVRLMIEESKDKAARETRKVLELELTKCRAELEMKVEKMKAKAKVDKEKVQTEAHAEVEKVKSETRMEMKKVRTEAQLEMKKVRTEAQLEMKKVRTEAQLEMKKVQAALQEEKTRLRAKISALEENEKVLNRAVRVEKRRSNDLDKKIRCVVCKVGQRSIVFRTCFHMAICGTCVKQHNHRARVTCPICGVLLRNGLAEVIKVCID